MSLAWTDTAPVCARLDCGRRGAFGSSKALPGITVHALGVHTQQTGAGALAIDQGAGAPVAVAGQLGDLLADVRQQLVVALRCALGSTINLRVRPTAQHMNPSGGMNAWMIAGSALDHELVAGSEPVGNGDIGRREERPVLRRQAQPQAVARIAWVALDIKLRRQQLA